MMESKDQNSKSSLKEGITEPEEIDVLFGRGGLTVSVPFPIFLVRGSNPQSSHRCASRFVESSPWERLVPRTNQEESTPLPNLPKAHKAHGEQGSCEGSA